MSPKFPLSVKSLFQDKSIQNLGLRAGTGAAIAVAVGNPIGAFGGAIYGACHGIVNQTANRFLQEKRIRSEAASIFTFIAATFAAWKFASLCGYVMSFKAALILGCGSPIAIYFASKLIEGFEEGFRNARNAQN